jgi:hypothetical protein
MDIEEIKENYEKMSDSKLIRIATQNAIGLRSEVFEIIEAEIKKRNLNPSLLQAALAQNRQLSSQEINGYSELLQNLPCPTCGDSSQKLNGAISYFIRSFLFSSTTSEITIACVNCLNKRNYAAIKSCAFLGWWAIPFGIINTPIYILKNVEAKRQHGLDQPSESLVSFIKSHIGDLEAYKDDKEKLLDLITLTHIVDDTEGL